MALGYRWLNLIRNWPTHHRDRNMEEQLMPWQVVLLILTLLPTLCNAEMRLHQPAPQTLAWDAPKDGGKVEGYTLNVETPKGVARLKVGNVLTTPCPAGPARVWVTAVNSAGESKPSNVVEVGQAQKAGTAMVRSKPVATAVTVKEVVK